jgi:hypothetical protein
MKKQKRTPAEMAADKNRTGRPAQGKEPRLIIVLLRVTATEKRTWTKAAKAAGLGLGPWIAAPRRAEMERGK